MDTGSHQSPLLFPLPVTQMKSINHIICPGQQSADTFDSGTDFMTHLSPHSHSNVKTGLLIALKKEV